MHVAHWFDRSPLIAVEMVSFAAASSYAIPFADTDFALSSLQVRLSKPALTFKIGNPRKNVLLGHRTSEPSVSFKFQASGSIVVARGQILVGTHGVDVLRAAQHDPKSVERSRRPLSPADAGDFSNQRSRSLSSPKTVIQPARGDASNELNDSDLQRQFHQGTHSAGQGPSDAQRDFPPTITVKASKNSQRPKRRGSRSSSRGFDVLDELMSSQGRSSKALLESLQSEVALAKDAVNNSRRDSEEHVLPGPSPSQEFPASKDVTHQHLEMGRMGGTPSGRSRPLQALFDSMSGNASASGTFSSSIERALSPVGVAKSSHSANVSSRNTDFVQHDARPMISDDKSYARRPGLQGQEVLWALQKAAIEKAKHKQKDHKPRERAVRGRESMSLLDVADWKNAKPIVLRPEWAHQIDDLERRIQILKNPI